MNRVHVVTLTTKQLKTLRLLCSRALNPKYSDLIDDDQQKVANAELALLRAKG